MSGLIVIPTFFAGIMVEPSGSSRSCKIIFEMDNAETPNRAQSFLAIVWRVMEFIIFAVLAKLSMEGWAGTQLWAFTIIYYVAMGLYMLLSPLIFLIEREANQSSDD